MSDTVEEIRDDLNDLGVKLQRQIDSLSRDVLVLAESINKLLEWEREEVQAKLAALDDASIVPVPQSLRA